ncbi:BrnA antitoxin family protein [Magnetospirillum sp. UT-4]|uniref:BrnA antitoxin family protein n=1 Tax=Magnetospirillum sp. UT-4 TaxID=2681467 RepID=UPI0015734B5B|nr:BrnA antitoxin family protein [Magnetospirillum sp. UT-4]
MSEERIVRRTLDTLRPGKTDWERLDRMTDEDIERAVAEDPDAAPILDETWWADAQLVLPEPKAPISIRLDREVLDWFKEQGPGYQSRMNAVLRAYMNAHRKAG